MKMKKLLSIGALALTITTCTSISAFAAESVGNRNEAAKEIAMNAYKGNKVVNNFNVTTSTPVYRYAKQKFVDGIKECVTKGVENTQAANELKNSIQSDYNNGLGLKEMFDHVVEINKEYNVTTNSSFDAAKSFLEGVLSDFEDAYDNGTLETTINNYFYVNSLNGELTYGKNSNNRLVVTLERKGQVILQVSSENVYSLQQEIENNIHSWADLNDYFNKVK